MLKTKILRAGLFCQYLVLISASGKTNPVLDLVTPGHVHTGPANSHTTLTNAKALCYCSSPLSERASADYLAITPNPGVEKFIIKYNKENNKLFNKLTDKKQNDFKLIENVFEKFEIPAELKYLAVVESKLISTATSRTGARGYWQLMPVTAKSLGLKITAKQDERTHSYKSTVAAARYLKELFTQFNDWLLVIAAYNGGAGTVYKAIKRSGSRDFWKLQYYLPFETRMHVKKYISTHYYFEGQGGLTTMSKKETEDHLATTANYLKDKDNISENNTYKNILASESSLQSKWIVIVRNVKKLTLVKKI